MHEPHRHTFSPETFHIRQLVPTDLPAFLDVQQAACARLPAGYIRARDEAQLSGYLDATAGAAFGVTDGTWLAAVGLLRMPGPADTTATSGKPFPLVPPHDWPQRVCLAENAMVRPAARGYGLQRLLLDARRAHAARAGMRWMCAGVHLQNSRSWSNLLAMGMQIVGIRFDAGYPVLGLSTALASLSPDFDPGDLALVAAHDAPAHESRLNDGYIGVRLAHDGGVIYARRVGAA